mmetsp:Transcript_41501/g.123998  ORF Transcript_41501/g.123998 Transcript_41501/m.123998 type:complete len:249 (+) Transcript_41501:110-856(+)
MAVADASPGTPGAEPGNGEEENGRVREICEFQCTAKSTFLYVVAPMPVLRRRSSSATPSTSSSSTPASSQSNSSLMGTRSALLRDRTGSADGGPSSDAEGASAEDTPEGNPGGAQRPAPAAKHQRPCKGKRVRFKRFVQYAQRVIRRDPHMDLALLEIPRFIERDDRAYTMMMQQLLAYKEQAIDGTLPPETEDGNEEGEGAPASGSTPGKRAASPNMRQTEPEAKRAAGSGRAPRPRRPSQRNIVSL